MINNLTKDDELFIRCLMTDITKNLCECECDCKDKECSIFERMFIARQLLETGLLVTQNEVFYYQDEHNNYIPIETLDTAATGGTTYALSATAGVGYTVLDTSANTYYYNGIELEAGSIYKKSGDSYDLAGTIYGYELEEYRMDFGTCIDWNTISARINNNYEQKNKFIDPSRKKLMSAFYMDIHGLSHAKSNTDGNLTLDVYLLGENSEYVITNCLDECCN